MIVFRNYQWGRRSGLKGVRAHDDGVHTAWWPRHLGAQLDADWNADGAVEIGSPSSRARLLVIPTDEERMIARQVQAVIVETTTAKRLS
jgi:hypothetical protein